MKRTLATAALSAIVLLSISCTPSPEQPTPHEQRLQVLFVGNDGPLQPTLRLRDVARPMLDRGISVYYSSDPADVSAGMLQRFDAVLLYSGSNQGLSAEQNLAMAKALADYVRSGGGLTVLHTASNRFSDVPGFGELIGGVVEAGQLHDTLTTDWKLGRHPLLNGFEPFTTRDREFDVSIRCESDCEILEMHGTQPRTWMRAEGEGRVFYSGWGMDAQTWQHPGFHLLLERGLRWVAGASAEEAARPQPVVNPFRYVVLDVPFPPPHYERMRYEAEVGPMDRGANYPFYYRKQEPLGPEEAISRMIVPPGFRVELFAAEPDIVNPIYMDWDERGRLWVIESVEYPYTREFWPDGGGKDRIIILEDTNGNGRADKVTEFASGLNIPTSLAFANGGVVVHQAPQTLFLKDTNGDGRADHRELLFEGWSQWDTHAGPNNLHYGLDNWLWGVMGYAGMNGMVGGQEHRFSMGLYRFSQDGSKLEFLQRTNNNTWGLGFNEEGQAFISTANGNPSTFHTIPASLYANVDGLNDPVTQRTIQTSRIIPLTNDFRQVDWIGAYTAAAGHAIYTADVWPERYHNRVGFVSEPTGPVVGEFVLEPSGSGYQSIHPKNLVASDDEWFSPIMAETGPDGHVWIADWYNYIIQHNAESNRQRPTPGNAYANPLRDRSHGRIYRVVYEGADAYRPMRLDNASAAKLVQTLAHGNLFWRKHAQRLLVERGQTDVVDALVALVNKYSDSEEQARAGAIHALWTLHGLGMLENSRSAAYEAAVQALQHPSAAVRLQAVQVLPPESASVREILQARILDDPDLRVRRQVLIALASQPASLVAGEALYHFLQHDHTEGDRYLMEAATIAASVHHRGFLSAAGRDGWMDRAIQLPAPGFSEYSLEEALSLIVQTHQDALGNDALLSDESTRATAPDRILEIGVVPNIMEYDIDELHATAGERLRIVFTNTDNMEHNLLIIRPGSLAEVGRLADAMVTAPDGRERLYIPDSPDVLAATPLLDPGEQYILDLVVPNEPGTYRFVCTVPGHWRIMNGVLHVGAAPPARALAP